MNERNALADYPEAVHVAADVVRQANLNSGHTLIVLDDDPTGTQSVSALPVLTSWDESDFDWAFQQGAPAIYVLTNSRSLGEPEAAQCNREIVQNATQAAARAGMQLIFVSRSDSTLRGHYPLETDVMAQTLVETTHAEIDGVVIVPAFPDAGRVTIGGVHYMRSGADLTPVAETEFAQDATFGYSSSELAAWVEEKSAGRFTANDVVQLTLDIVRGGAAGIADAISEVAQSTPIIADAVTEDDLRLLSLGLIEAESRGKQLLYRVGPPFVRARIGQDITPPLTQEQVFGPQEIFRATNADTPEPKTTTAGGLIVVGSHVGLTTRQLTQLTNARPDIATVEIDVERVLAPGHGEDYVAQMAHTTAELLSAGDVIVHTSRTLKRADSPEESLHISRQVSSSLIAVVQHQITHNPPRFVIAKGGITSSDVATHGLGIRRAIVRGPMLPGIVSLWQPVDGPAVGTPYVVFAGNVGDDTSLVAVVNTLSAV